MNRVGLAAAILLVPGGFILGATLAARHYRNRKAGETEPAAEAPDEFFAVACEAFFITPRRLQAAHPALYAELQGFFQQDPAQHVA